MTFKPHYSIGMLLLRVGAGMALAAHGYPKLFGGEGKKAPDFASRIYGKNFQPAVERSGPASFSQTLERIGIPSPRAVSYLVGATEFGGGVALALGLATRFIATAVFINMFVAIRKVHWKNGMYGQGGYELAGLFAIIAAAIGMTGPGKISLDWLLRRESA